MSGEVRPINPEGEYLVVAISEDGFFASYGPYDYETAKDVEEETRQYDLSGNTLAETVKIGVPWVRPTEYDE
jgi:hypothetical protein